MILPTLITVGILGALYASRATSPRAEYARVKEFEVRIDPFKYGANAPGFAGKHVACSNDPECDARNALLDLGWTEPVLVRSDDPDLSAFRMGRVLTLDFDVKGDLRADRDVPPWMFYALRDPSPVTARFA